MKRRNTENPFKPLLIGIGLLLVGCSASEAGSAISPDAAVSSDAGDLSSADSLPGKKLVVEVPAGERVYVRLDTPALLEPGVSDSSEWDIAFEGWEIFTNSGPSGPGKGGSFGPNDDLDFLFDEVPAVPFMRADATGGAFFDWYDYDGANHALWSRYHVYGVRSGSSFFKVQVLGYYGEEFGAPVSALYRLRYAEVNAEGLGTTHEIENLDATAGGPDISEDTASGCLILKTGEITPLTPSEALEASSWDLCLRRENISVNGGRGGPGEVTAVDLQGARTRGESLDEVKSRTAASELDVFEAAGYEALTDDDLEYRGDRVLSLFLDRWFEGQGKAAKPTKTSWLVRGASGSQHYMIVFLAIEGDADSAGKVTLQVRPLEDE